jgi:hypothetical protein
MAEEYTVSTDPDVADAGSARSILRLDVDGDDCSGSIWTAHPTGGGWGSEELLDTTLGTSSFGEDGAGEIYVLDVQETNGSIYRIGADPAGEPSSCDGFEAGDTTRWSRAS